MERTPIEQLLLRRYCGLPWLLATFFFVLPFSLRGQVVLNELMADNRTTVTNGGDFPDWLELYNPSASTVNLGGMSLTDSTNSPAKFVFPADTFIAPEGYLVVWCDNRTNSPGLHSGFNFKKSGELAALYSSNGTILQDRIVFGPQVEDLTIGRVPNGAGSWQLTVPTPNQSNQTAVLGSPFDLKFNEWLALNSTNVDGDWFELYNPTNLPVALGGLVFTDTFSGMPLNQAVPALSFIGGESFVQFFADSTSMSKDADHVDFRLSSTSGETLTLYASDRTTVIDRVSFGPQMADISQGRLPDGGSGIVSFPTDFVSPAAPNKFQPLTNVVINEVLSHTDPPLEDAIELYNPTTARIEISHWYLSDSKSNPAKYRIPSGTFIETGQHRVFYENQFNPDMTGNAPSFSLNGAHGDEVYLSTADANGFLTGFRHRVSFGAAENGVSFGRYLTSVEAHFVTLSTRTFGMDEPSTLAQFRTGVGLSNAPPVVGPIVINEVMYHPPDNGTNDNTLDEYIELYNVTDHTVLLYDPLATTNTWRISDAVDFIFPRSVSLKSNSYLLVVSFDPAENPAQLAAFRTNYGIPSAVPIFGPFAGKLDNSDESVELYKPDSPQAPPQPDAGFVPYILIDKVHYSDIAPWPTEPDGNGASLQRRTPSHYGNDPANWIGSPPSAGRTNNLPGLPRITSCAWSGDGSFRIRFTAAAGATYSVQYRNALTSGEWQKLLSGDIGAEPAPREVEIIDETLNGSPGRFYRLVSPGIGSE